jgi:hypothetical protein
MNISNKKIKKDIYELGANIGLNLIDIKKILNETSQITQSSSHKLGPEPYMGGFYGTISIKDIK